MTDVQDLIGLVASAATSVDLKRALRAAVRENGFQYFQLQRFKLRQLVDCPWLDLPAPLASAVSKGGSAFWDPVALKALDSHQPLWWHQLKSEKDTEKRVAAWMAQYEAAGLNVAAAVPIHGCAGICDVLHVWSEDAGPAKSADQANLMQAKLMAVSAAAYVCSTRLRQIDHAAFGQGARDVQLSVRELEVLRWCKDGKSYSEIGTIMGISSKTVEFHIYNIMRKLGVNQKISAILVAARQGLISL